MRTVQRLARDQKAAVGAEFALVVPIFILFLLGIVDAGRMMWTYNRAEKALQMGTRYAAVTEMVDTGLADYDYYTTDGIARGDPIADDDLSATCTSTGCTCTGTCPGLGTFNDVAFNNTVARMRAIMPDIKAENVTIEYSHSGLGYSGDPYGPDINPLITVRLGSPSAVVYRPALGWVLGASINLPVISSTLSMEDGRWAIAN